MLCQVLSTPISWWAETTAALGPESLTLEHLYFVEAADFSEIYSFCMGQEVK